MKGTDKQRKWAEDIIAKLRRDVAASIDSQRPRVADQHLYRDGQMIDVWSPAQQRRIDMADRASVAYTAIIDRIVAEHDDSTWWIDNGRVDWRTLIRREITESELAELEALSR